MNLSSNRSGTRLHSWRQAVLVAGMITLQSALADNTAATARDLGTDPAQFEIREVVGAADSVDYYKFSLSGKRSIQLSLSELSGDADLYLMGDNGTWLSSTRRGYGLVEGIRRDLDAGSYRVMVYGWAGSVNHRFSLKTWSTAPTQGISQVLPALDGMNDSNKTVVASGTIAPSTAYIDYYFTLPGRRQISVQGSGRVSAGVTADTQPVQWTILKNNQVRDLRLQAGKHYLRVFRNPSSSESFSFTINARPYDTRDSAGFSTSTARDLGRVGNPPVQINEYVGQDDFDDYYRVNVGQNSQLNVALSHTSGQGANVRVFDPLGRVIAQSANSGSASENIRTNAVSGGIYYVHVGTSARSGSNLQDARYSMLVGTVPAPGPVHQVGGPSADASESFNSPTLFADVGQVPGSGGQSLSDGETVGGPADPADIFYFNIGCNLARQVPTFAIRPSASPVTFRLFENINGRPVEQAAAINSTNKPTYRGRSSYRYFLMVSGPAAAAASYTATIEHLGCLPG